MILLKTLQLNNFLSHEKTEIEFKEVEKILLDGKSGSGKSTTTEAILWCLYGKGRSENRSLVRRGTKSATVSLKFVDGEQETIITRTVSIAGKNTLTVTQNTGSKRQFLPIERVGIKDIQDWIEKIFLKASYELFTNSVAYPQENENSFVKTNASRRKDLLLEIVRAGNFDELYDKARKAITANELETAVGVSKIENLESTIKTSEEVAKHYDLHKKTLEEASVSLEGYLHQEKALETQLNEISQTATRIADKKKMRQIFITSIEKIDTELKKDAADILQHKSIDISNHKKNILEIETLSKEVEKIENELKNNAIAQQKINAHLSNKPQCFDYGPDIEAINKRLIPLIKETGKCPAGDACPFVKPIKGQIDFLTEQITEKTTKIVSEKTALEAWERVYATIAPVKDTTDLYKKLKDIKETINILSVSKDIVTKYDFFQDGLGEMNVKELRLKMERDQSNIEIVSIDSQIKELEETFVKINVNQINIDLANIRNSKTLILKTKDEAALAMALAKEAEVVIKNSSTELVELRKAISKALEEKECLELLKEALSPRGIKAVVIDYLVPQLEDRINTVLGQMSDFRIRLDTQKATVDEEGVKEGLFITVLNDRQEELPFASYSGGEKVKITIAISEALASLMNQIGFRIMDENIVSLDRESTEGFVIVLTKLQEKFPQLLVISHLQEVKDMFQKQVIIIKTNGISQIK